MKNKPTKTSLGRLIEIRMKKENLRYHEIAQKLGCATSTVSDIINGHNRPSIKIAGALSKWLDIPFSEIYRLAGIDIPSSGGIEVTEHEAVIIYRYRELSSFQKEIIDNLVLMSDNPRASRALSLFNSFPEERQKAVIGYMEDMVSQSDD